MGNYQVAKAGGSRGRAGGAARPFWGSSHSASIGACGPPAPGSPTFFTGGIQRARCRGLKARVATNGFR